MSRAASLATWTIAGYGCVDWWLRLHEYPSWDWLTDGCVESSALYTRYNCGVLPPWQANLYTTLTTQCVLATLGIASLIACLSVSSRYHSLTSISVWLAWVLIVHLHHRTDPVNTLKDKLYRWLLFWLACCLSNRSPTRWRRAIPTLATVQLAWVYCAFNVARLQDPASPWRDASAVCVLQARQQAEHGTPVLDYPGASAWLAYSQSPAGCRMLTTLLPTMEVAAALLLLASLFLRPLRKVARVLSYVSLLMAHAMMAAWTDDGRWLLISGCVISIHHYCCHQVWHSPSPALTSRRVSSLVQRLVIGLLGLLLIYAAAHHDLALTKLPRVSSVDTLISTTKLHQGWRFHVSPSPQYGLQRWQLQYVVAPKNHTVSTAPKEALQSYDLLRFTADGWVRPAPDHVEDRALPWKAGSQWTQVLGSLAGAEFQAHNRFSKQIKWKLCADVVLLDLRRTNFDHSDHLASSKGHKLGSTRFEDLVKRSGIRLRHELGRLVAESDRRWRYQSVAQVFDVLQVCDSLYGPKRGNESVSS
eukprot:m.135365 g.135365  ORF g.135365 m.135365 type:complete len:531 (+) comp15990_c1_seq1:1413-3005(+)